MTNSRIRVPAQYACTGQRWLQTQNLSSTVRTRNLAKPGFLVNFSWLVAKLVETGFLACGRGPWNCPKYWLINFKVFLLFPDATWGRFRRVVSSHSAESCYLKAPLRRRDFAFLHCTSKIIPSIEVFLRLRELGWAVFCEIEQFGNFKYVGAIVAVVS